MKDVIENALKDNSLKAGREEARNQAWMHRGESTKLITDYLLEKQNALNEAVK